MTENEIYLLLLEPLKQLGRHLLLLYLNLIYYFFGDGAEAVADAVEMLRELS